MKFKFFGLAILTLLFSTLILFTSCGSTSETTEVSDSANAMSIIREYARTNGMTKMPQIKDYQDAGVRGVESNKILIQINNVLKEDEIGANEIQLATDIQMLLYDRDILETSDSEERSETVVTPIPTVTVTPSPKPTLVPLPTPIITPTPTPISIPTYTSGDSLRYGQWVKPSKSTCESNGGEYRDYNSKNNECDASWENATLICHASGYTLATSRELKAVLTNCNKFYQACYRDAGFSAGRYWSSYTVPENSSAWLIDFHDGLNGWYDKTNVESVRCITGTSSSTPSPSSISTLTPSTTPSPTLIPSVTPSITPSVTPSPIPMPLTKIVNIVDIEIQLKYDAVFTKGSESKPVPVGFQLHDPGYYFIDKNGKELYIVTIETKAVKNRAGDIVGYSTKYGVSYTNKTIKLDEYNNGENGVIILDEEGNDVTYYLFETLSIDNSHSNGSDIGFTSPTDGYIAIPYVLNRKSQLTNRYIFNNYEDESQNKTDVELEELHRVAKTPYSYVIRYVKAIN